MKNYKHQAMIKPDQPERPLGVRPSQKGSSAEEASLDMADIWDGIRRGKWIILLTTVLVTGAILAYTLSLEPTYEAGTIVSIQPPPGTAATTRMVGYGMPSGLSQQIGILGYSVELAMRVAEDLKQHADSTGAGQQIYPVLYGEQDSLLSNRQVATQLFEQVEFVPLPEQRMIQISASSPVPEEAAAIANFYAQEYRKYSREQARASISATREFLEEQVVKRRKELRRLQEQWAQFARQTDMMVQGEGGQMLVNQYVSLQMQQNALAFQLDREQAALQNLQERLQEVRPRLRTEITQEQAAQSLQQRVAALDQQIAQLKTQAQAFYIINPDLEGKENLGPEYEELVRLRHQIDGLEEQRAELTDQFISESIDEDNLPAQGNALGLAGQLRSQIMQQKFAISQTRSQIEAIEQQLGTYSGRLQGIPQQVINRQRIERRRAQAEQIYTMLMGELQRVIIAEEGKLGYVELVQQAYPPNFPVSPDLKQNLVLGLLLGLGFGIGLAFIRQAANTYFHDPEDVQEKGYSLVGVIPRMDREIKATFKGEDTVEVEGRTVSTHLLPLLNPWSPISENYRLVRTNLQFPNNGQGMPQLLLVTSPEMSDGKTLTSVNLAITMAQSGRRVLLIDADLRRPAAHALLGEAQGPGLAEILLHDGERNGALAEKHVQHTAVDNLDFLAAGHMEEPPAEALGSDRMAAVLQAARDRYEAVVVDSPPLLAVSDPIVLAKQCDATLAVVSAERTDLRALEVARETLEAVGVPIAGVVFNRFEAEHETGYGYGYRYGYEYEGYTYA